MDNTNNYRISETKKRDSNKKYLVIITDMDDDIGRKAHIKTPILGRDDCINAAIKLGLSDPGDTDINSILGGVKFYDELKQNNYSVEVAIVSGHKNVESEKCAKRIKEQIDFLMYLYEPDFIYLVSDGKEDELIINYIDRKEVFVWKKRIVVKQNESLESTYYLIQEFLKKTMSQYVPFIFTAIGFTLVIYAIFAGLGWRIIAGMVGIYVLSEGSGFLKSLKKSIKEGKESLEFGKIAPVGNIICWVIIIIGILYAYNISRNLEFIDAVGIFLYTVANPFTLGMLIYITIHFIDDILHTTKDILILLKRFFFKILIIFMSRELLIEFSQYLDGKVSFMMISIYVVIYISILIILSAILFYVKGSKDENQPD